MNNVCEIVTKIDNNVSFKEVIIVVIIKKDINYIMIEYLSQNNELQKKLIEGDKLISQNSYNIFKIDENFIECLKESTYILNSEIINSQNITNHVFQRIKKINN